MHITKLYPLLLIVVFFLSACAQRTSDQTGTASPKIVKSQDGSFDGEVIGEARAGSKFSGLKIGMQMKEVQDIMNRAPDRSHTYESGKRWIPFYFGNDARRLQVLFKDEGCLIFADGNAWGGAGGDLIQIYHDPSGACYQP
ncbi:MAG TPA: hypothetical protein PLB54_09140 [Nitrosomonas sp.]|nr:hypothetical protein [Nitrosomonas sp.]